MEKICEGKNLVRQVNHCDDEQLYRQIEETIEDLMENIQRDFYLEYEPAQDKFIVKTSLTKEKAEFFEKMSFFRRQSLHSNSPDESSTEDSDWESTNSDLSDTSESQEEPIEAIEDSSSVLKKYWHGTDTYYSLGYNCKEVNFVSAELNSDSDSVKKSSSTCGEDGNNLLERVFKSLKRLESIRKGKNLNSQESFNRKKIVKDFEEPKCLKISDCSNKTSQRTLCEKLANIFCPCAMDK